MSDGEESFYDEESVDEFDDNQDEIDLDVEAEAEENKPIDEQLQEENEDEDENEDDKQEKEIIIKKLDIYKKENVIKELYNTETITITAPENRRSRPIISTGEKAALLAYRVATIQNGEPYYLPPNIPVPSNPIEIAILEMKNLMSPLVILRNMGKTIEIWSPNEMIHPRSDV